MNVYDEGQENVLEISPELRDLPLDLNIHFRGSRNYVRIGDNPQSQGALISLGDDCRVEIANQCTFGASQFHLFEKGTLRVGFNVRFAWDCQINMHEESLIDIGAESLIAGGTWLTTSDMHSVIDQETGKRINPPEDIIVGEHVWIAARASILKGATIGRDSIVAAFAVVTEGCPAGCILGGSPARIIKRGVNWDFERLPFERKAAIPNFDLPNADHRTFR